MTRRVIVGLTAIVVVALAASVTISTLVAIRLADLQVQQARSTERVAECIYSLLLIPIDVRYTLPEEELRSVCPALGEVAPAILTPRSQSEPVQPAPAVPAVGPQAPAPPAPATPQPAPPPPAAAPAPQPPPPPSTAPPPGAPQDTPPTGVVGDVCALVGLC